MFHGKVFAEGEVLGHLGFVVALGEALFVLVDHEQVLHRGASSLVRRTRH
jgi:hypothetical protein